VRPRNSEAQQAILSAIGAAGLARVRRRSVLHEDLSPLQGSIYCRRSRHLGLTAQATACRAYGAGARWAVQHARMRHHLLGERPLDRKNRVAADSGVGGVA